MSQRIFLSYRRRDAGGWSSRLYDGLIDHFGERSVFRDAQEIDFGDAWKRSIRESIEASDVFVALIGPDWNGGPGKSETFRILEDDDPVRNEISHALVAPCRVLSVLLEATPMPGEDALPDDLRGLPAANALHLSDRYWKPELAALCAEIEQEGGGQRSFRRFLGRVAIDPLPIFAWLVMLSLFAFPSLSTGLLLGASGLAAVLCGATAWRLRRTRRFELVLAWSGLLAAGLLAWMAVSTGPS